MTTVSHRRFDLGINQDKSSFLLDEGYVYSSKNMLYDKVGTARKRGGLSGVGATSAYNGDHLGVLLQGDGTRTFYSMQAAAPRANAINPTTGVYTDLGLGTSNVWGTDTEGGRPFIHYGFMMWPIFSDVTTASFVAPVACAGANGAVAAYTFATPASIVLTAGRQTIACAAGDNPLTKLQVGQIVFLIATGSLIAYCGRVTQLVSTTSFNVYPAPSVAQASCIAGSASYNAFLPQSTPSAIGSNPFIGGKVGMSFQGRACLGNTTRHAWTPFDLGVELFPRRCNFSATLLEQDSASTSTTIKTQGAVWTTNDGFPENNYFDIPGSDPITAMSPTGFGDAVVFSAYRAFRVTGNLSTQFGTTASITWQVREIPNSVGCMSERSMRRSPKGIIFAHDSGVYATDGSSMQPLMFKTVSNAWRTLVNGTGFKIYGSAMARSNHYYICGTSGGVLWGWLLNLDTLAWSFLDGKTTAPASWIINSGEQDPANPSKVYGLKWWDQTAAAPSMTAGQLVTLDGMFNPTVANRTDSDTTIVRFEVVTRPYSEDKPGIEKNWLAATIEYAMTGGSDCTVTPALLLDASRLDPVPYPANPFFHLPDQTTYTVTVGGGTPIVLTIGAHTLQADDWVFVQGVLGLTNANGPWRIQSVNATQITLLGSSQNAVYTSGGTVNALDAKDIPLYTALAKAGFDGSAMLYRINDGDGNAGTATGCDSFELQGIIHTWEDRDPHVE